MWSRKKKQVSVEIPIARTVPGQFHLRSNSTSEGIAALAVSIRTHGLLYPILVTGGPKRYELIAGLRRLHACRRLGWKKIPANILTVSPEQAAEVSLLENLHRQELSEADRIRAIALLLSRWSTGSALRLMRRLGVEESDVEASLRLGSLSPIVKESLRAGLIHVEEALVVDALDNRESEKALIKKIHQERETNHKASGTSQSPRPVDRAQEQSDAQERFKPKPRVSTDSPQAGPKASSATPDAPSELSGASLLESTEAMIQTYRDEAKIDFDTAERVVSTIIRNLKRSNREVLHLDRDIKQDGSYLPQHTLNVTRLAIYTGVVQGRSDSELRLLGLGSMFHDIGMAQVPPTILAKSGPLSQPELETIRKHATSAHAAVSTQRKMEKPVLDMIIQHHERVDGSGYPKGLRGNDLSDMSHSITIIDTYVAMISRRDYRRSFYPSAAMEMIMHDAFRGQYDKKAFQDFLSALSLYPIGSHIQLSGGEIARVVGSNPSDPNRPIVDVLTDTARHCLPKPVKVNLLNELDCKVLKAVAEDELANLMTAAAN